MLINEFWKIPFLRFILPFILGILIASTFELSPIVWISLTCLFVGLSLAIRPFFNHEQSYHRRWIFGTLASFSLLFTGAFITESYSDKNGQIPEAQKVIGYIEAPIKETEKSIKLQLQITEYQTNDIWKKDDSKVLVYLEKDSTAKTLSYGDMLLLKGNFTEIENTGNPYEFDYKTYQARKKIYCQSYQNSEQWLKLSSNQGNFLFSFAYNTRNDILKIYESSGIKGDEFAILAALTLGVKDYLSDEVVEAYSDSGAMHVLAVSGLHVGIITMVLGFLLSPLRKNRKLIILQSAIIIIVLWFFALITGLAPSVSRASLMFTFYIIGKNSGRKPSPFNSVAASAFIILLLNPMALFNVGFQLSYLAVIAILFFQPRIYRWFDIKNILLDKIWALTAVSIAAQIGTTPISIFYFHQFPIYALFTNLIAIPAAFIIMCGAIALIISGIYSPLSEFIGTPLSYFIKALNYSTKTIENLPFASIEHISLNHTELLLLYLALTLLIILLIVKNKKLVFIICILCIVAYGLRDLRYINEINAKSLVVFNTHRKSSFATISNRSFQLYADSSLLNNKKSTNYLTSNLITATFTKKVNLKSPDINTNDFHPDFPGRIIEIDTIKAAYIFDKLTTFTTSKKLDINYLILSKNTSLDLGVMQNLFDFQKLIIDSSVPQWKQKILKQDCENKGIRYHNITEQGAFVWKSYGFY